MEKELYFNSFEEYNDFIMEKLEVKFNEVVDREDDIVNQIKTFTACAVDFFKKDLRNHKIYIQQRSKKVSILFKYYDNLLSKMIECGDFWSFVNVFDYNILSLSKFVKKVKYYLGNDIRKKLFNPLENLLEKEFQIRKDVKSREEYRKVLDIILSKLKTEFSFSFCIKKMIVSHNNIRYKFLYYGRVLFTIDYFYN